MKIIRDGKEINALAITYFTPKGKRFFGLDKDNEYLIYTIPDESKEKTLYLAKINHIDETIRLVLPNEEELKFLKSIGFKSYIKVGHGQIGNVNDTIVADVFEAILAAIYIDGGYRAAKEFALPFVVKKIKEFARDGVWALANVTVCDGTKDF